MESREAAHRKIDMPIPTSDEIVIASELVKLLQQHIDEVYRQQRRDYPARPGFRQPTCWEERMLDHRYHDDQPRPYTVAMSYCHGRLSIAIGDFGVWDSYINTPGELTYEYLVARWRLRIEQAMLFCPVVG